MSLLFVGACSTGPVADLNRASNGSVLAAPMVYIPNNALANSATEYGCASPY